MPELKMQMPDLPPGKRFNGEYRQVQPGEWYCDDGCNVRRWMMAAPSAGWYPIVVDTWVPPAGFDSMLKLLQPGWLTFDHWHYSEGAWMWHNNQPSWEDPRRWCSTGILKRLPLNFIHPHPAEAIFRCGPKVTT